MMGTWKKKKKNEGKNKKRDRKEALKGNAF